MPSRHTLVSWALGLGVAACAGAAAWWWLDVERSAFYTDGASLQIDESGHAPRDVLWEPPEPVVTAGGEPIVADHAFVTADESLMLLARRTERGDLDLFHAVKTEDGWTEPEPVDALNTPDNELSPSLSGDGQSLYFASDRPGGLGGLDIWRSERTDLGWSPPMVAPGNSTFDDTDPRPVNSPLSGLSLVFASDRPQTDSDDARNSRSIFGSKPDGTVIRLIEAEQGTSLAAPAVTPAGDFLYWISESADDASGLAMLRARLGALLASAQADAQQTPASPQPIDDSIASLAGVASPSLAVEGFVLNLLTGDEDDHRLVRAVSREVYLARSSSRGDLLRVIPWILLSLAVVLLLSMLRRGAQSVRWSSALGTLGLMARCVLASLVIHAGLLALLALLEVPSESGEPSASSTGRVALSSSATRSALAGQVRELAATTSVAEALAPASSPTPATPRPRSAERSEPALALSSSTPTPASRPLSVSEAELSRTISAMLAADAGPAMTDLPTASPTVELPAAERLRTDAAPEPAAQAFRRAGVEHTSPPIDLPATQSVAEPELGTASIKQARLEPRAMVQPTDATPGVASEAIAELDIEPTALAESFDVADVALPSPAASPIRSNAADEPARSNDYLRLADVRASINRLAAPDGNSKTEILPDARTAVAVPPEPLRTIEPAKAETGSNSPPAVAALPPTDLPALDGFTLPAAVDLSFDLTGVVVDDDTDRPIGGAVVRLDLASERDAETRTREDGTFGLSFESMPDTAAITATADGYDPGAVNVSSRQMENGDRITIRLARVDPFLIALEARPAVHHLGDDAFTGRINSQFQRESEGLSIRFEFTLTERHAELPARGVEFRVLAKGTQLDNPVFVNGVQIGTFDESPSNGDFGEQRFRVPRSALRLGNNTVELRSVKSSRTDHDDYEFVNPRIIFLPAGGGPI